jgi:hypothetical protein
MRPLRSKSIMLEACLEQRSTGEFFPPLLYIAGARTVLSGTAGC